MFHIYSAHFTIIVLAILKLSYATNEAKIEVIPLSSNQKYCLIQVQQCGPDLHPLCKMLAKAYENQNAEHIEFLELEKTDKSNLLLQINKFRDKLAGGQINGYKSGSNIRFVKWSLHFAELAEANYLYNSFCNKISLNNSEFVEETEFLDEKGTGPYFYERAIIEKVNDSYGDSIWNVLFRAEFDRIGCAWVNDTANSLYKFFCYTNRNGPDDEEFSFENAYKLGKPCTECGVGKCNEEFRNLCGTSGNPDEFEHNRFDPGDYNDDVDDSNLILFIIIGAVMLALAIVIGLIFLCICLRDGTNNSGETYTIKQTRRNRGDLFADTIYEK